MESLRHTGELIKRGKNALAEIHLAEWVIDHFIPGLPAAIISGAAWIYGLPWPIVAAVAIVVLAAGYLVVLGTLGYRKEARLRSRSRGLEIEITDPEETASVPRHRVISGHRTANCPVQVLVFSPDNQWYPQALPQYDGGSWQTQCWFGNDTTPAGTVFSIIAIDGTSRITQPVPTLPTEGSRSQIVTVKRASQLRRVGTLFVFFVYLAAIIYLVAQKAGHEQHAHDAVTEVTRPTEAPNYNARTMATTSSLVTTVGDHLSPADRERLADALFDFSQTLDQGNKLWGRANQAAAKLTQDWQSGQITKNLETHRNAMRDLQSLSKDYERTFLQYRQKWKYYSSQVASIFGNNPDNDALFIRNAADEYLNFLNSWAEIQNKDDRRILDLSWPEQIRFDEAVRRFALWSQDCEGRLQQVRASLR